MTGGTETEGSGPEITRPSLRQQETGSTPQGVTPPTVQLASLPRQWRAEADTTSPGATADLGDTSDVRRVAYAAALLDCAQELQAVLSISPRGCWEHPGIPGYRHPECGFCWHGRDGLDVPTAGEGANREPVCPRCHPQLPDGQVTVSREDRAELERLAPLVLAGPNYGDREGTWHGRAKQLAQMVVNVLPAAAGDPQ